MKGYRRGSLLAVLVLAASFPVAGAGCASAGAGGPNRAAVVVQLSDDAVEEHCVSFAEDSISGLELLRRTGLPIAYEDYGADGAFVCRIGSTGCRFPAEPCACEYARTGRFWGYYRVENDRWAFSDEGAARTEVRDGGVEGWRWGKHGTGGASPPPFVTAAGVCARAEPAAAATADERGPWRTAGALGSVGLVVLVVARGLRRVRGGERP